MNILVLVNKPPFPAHDGGAIATLQLIRALAGYKHNLYVFYLNTSKHHFNTEDIPDEYSDHISFFSASVNTSVNWLSAIFSFFGSGTPYIYKRFYNPAVTEQIKSLSNKISFDLLLFDGLGISVYKPFLQHLSVRTILRTHNVESDIWERMFGISHSGFKKIYYRRMAGQIRSYEQKMIHLFPVLVPVSNKDADVFKSWHYTGRVQVLPVGIDTGKYSKTTVRKNINTVLFLGSLEWEPNIQGLTWFIRKVWPQIIREAPGTTLQIAGRRPSKRIDSLSRARGVDILGEINDSVSFLHRGTLFVVPLFAGSGIRIKIIEAMAAGCAIVSTTLGAEGIPVQHEKHLLLADDPARFAGQVIRLLKDTDLRKTIEKNGLQFVREFFGDSTIEHRLQRIVEEK